MKKMISHLEKLGFTRTECLVYIQLVKAGQSNGSQIAKLLNMSRSSVYSALNKL